MEIRLQASKTLKFSTQEEADHQLQTISDTDESHSIALTADPLCEKIVLGSNLKSDKISYLSCCGDNDESGAVLDFSWIQDLRRQCISLDIPFYFTGTGSNFRMKGRDFHIDKKFQESQARKSEMNYFPVSRALNPPSITDTSKEKKIESNLFDFSDEQNTGSYESGSHLNYGKSNKDFRPVNGQNSSFNSLRNLGFRPVLAEDSSNPFLKDAAEDNPFETSDKSSSQNDRDEMVSFTDTDDLTIPHINYRIDIEDEPENEFANIEDKKDILMIPGINYEVELENFSEEPPEYSFKEQDMNELFSHLARSKFRSGFHLHKSEREYFKSHGEDIIRQHAADFIAKRLAPSEPDNDGKQTPMKGHPVFIAQHATACCCRGCLKKWHHIPEHRALSDKEQNYIVDVIMTWIKRDMQGI